MPDSVVVLEPGDERAQKIAKAMASQTAGDILRGLAGNKQSLSEITDHLALPLTTVKYHIENLLDAGLIQVADTKYSIKGREVKIYSLSDQLFIVAPKQSNVRSLILRYASLFGIVGIGTFVLSLVLPLLAVPLPGTDGNDMVMLGASPVAPEATHGAVAMANKMAYESTGGTSLPVTDPIVTFFIGGIFVIFVLMVYEIYLWKNTR